MIELRSIHKVYVDGDGREHAALRGVDLSVERGEVHALIGTSGCGKTTTLRLVNRLEEPTSGAVLVDGVDVRDEDPIALRRRIGYVIQTGGLFPHWTVARNIGAMGELEGRPRARVEERTRALMQLVDLSFEELGARLPKELSGGQRQRVGIARALALDPAHLLLDEPFGALDPITRAGIVTELRPIFAKLGKTVLLVTHDLDEAFRLGDRVTLMDRGAVVQTGVEQDFRARPASPFVERFVAGAAGGRR